MPSIAQTKTCSKCKIKKPLSEFGSNRSRKDGKAHYCKACASDQGRKWSDEHPDYERQRRHEYYQNNKERLHKYRSDERKKHPKKYRARDRVKHLVSKKDLPHISTQKCKDCGKQAQEYHHPDYDRPEVVVPLCCKCHASIHRLRYQ